MSDERPEIYLSTDIESDGPLPIQNSMLSLGTAAFTEHGKLIATFSANIMTLLGAVADPKTMAWWATNQKAYDATRTDLEEPFVAMTRYVEWIEQLPGKPVFVGYPAGYDFLFVYTYLLRFAGRSPFSFSAIDVKTFAMATLKLPYRKVSKKTMPARWFDENLPHTHVALDDAIEQGHLFCKMLIESRRHAAGAAASTLSVHILHHGLTLCRSFIAPPNSWPAGHSWVGVDDADKLATCPACLAAHLVRRNVKGNYSP